MNVNIQKLKAKSTNINTKNGDIQVKQWKNYKLNAFESTERSYLTSLEGSVIVQSTNSLKICKLNSQIYLDPLSEKYCFSGFSHSESNKVHTLCNAESCEVTEQIDIQATNGNIYVNILSSANSLFSNNFCETSTCDSTLEFSQASLDKIAIVKEKYENLGRLDNAVILNVKSPEGESSIYKKMVIVSSQGYSRLKPW